MSNYAYPVTGQWRKTSGTLFDAFRANAPFYWALVSKAEMLPSALLPAAKIEGLGVGDLHIKNFDMVEDRDGERKLQLIDLDDGGRTSLLLDFARGVMGIRLSPFNVPTEDLWRAYLAGLRGEKAELPAVLKEAKQKSAKDFLELQEKLLARLTDGSRFSAKAGVQPIELADSKTQKLFGENRDSFLRLLSPAEVLDTGFFIKDGGGSQGIPRFWFLIQHPDQRREIIEIKTMAEPAVALYRAQDKDDVRFASLVRAYRTSRPFGRYEVVKGKVANFIVRTKLKGFLHLDPKDVSSAQDIEDGREVSLYLANRVGRWHGEQPAGAQLLAVLSANEPAARSAFQQFVESVIAIMQQRSAHSN